MINGIDVSEYQGTIDWKSVRYVADFAFIRAFGLRAWTFPTTHDAKFTENWHGAKKAGLVVGPYAFGRFDIEPTHFANVFVDALIGIGYGTLGDLAPVLDIETPPPNTPERTTHDGFTVAERQAWVWEVADVVERATGRCPIFYTGVHYWNTALGGTDVFDRHPLWLARYKSSTTTGTELPNGWRRWTFWQWTSSGNTSGYPSVPGVPGRVDLNLFDGDRGDLLELARR